MENMKLAKALKVKNRLAGEIGKLKAQIQTFNVVREKRIYDPDTPLSKPQVFKRERPIDVRKTMDQLMAKIQELITLKTAISKANVGIYGKIAEMEEAKGFLAYNESLPCEREDDTDTDDKVTTVTHWDAIITSQEKIEVTAVIQKNIEKLQDEIDEYNATTYIG